MISTGEWVLFIGVAIAVGLSWVAIIPLLLWPCHRSDLTHFPIRSLLMICLFGVVTGTGVEISFLWKLITGHSLTDQTWVCRVSFYTIYLPNSLLMYLSMLTHVSSVYARIVHRKTENVMRRFEMAQIGVWVIVWLMAAVVSEMDGLAPVTPLWCGPRTLGVLMTTLYFPLLLLYIGSIAGGVHLCIYLIRHSLMSRVVVHRTTTENRITFTLACIIVLFSLAFFFAFVSRLVEWINSTDGFYSVTRENTSVWAFIIYPFIMGSVAILTIITDRAAYPCMTRLCTPVMSWQKQSASPDASSSGGTNTSRGILQIA